MVNEPLRIIGNRAGQTTYDVVVIHGASVRFEMSNPILVLPIPSTGNTTIPETKLINLRRVTRKIILSGYIIDTTYVNTNFNQQTCTDTNISDGSARVVGFTSASGALAYNNANCIAVKKAIEKKWILEQFALAGTTSEGKGLTVQWREIVNPSGTDYNKNVMAEKIFISELTIEDSAENPSYVTSSFHYPERFLVKMTLVNGTPEA